MLVPVPNTGRPDVVTRRRAWRKDVLLMAFLHLLQGEADPEGPRFARLQNSQRVLRGAGCDVVTHARGRFYCGKEFVGKVPVSE